MFRIGFDPMLEVEQRNTAVIREMHNIRLANEAMNSRRLNNRNSNKLLALIGRQLAAFGTTLIARYDDPLENPLGLNQQNPSGSCS